MMDNPKFVDTPPGLGDRIKAKIRTANGIPSESSPPQPDTILSEQTILPIGQIQEIQRLNSNKPPIDLAQRRHQRRQQKNSL